MKPQLNITIKNEKYKMEDDLKGLKVIVIDDSNTIRRTAETLLTKAGCEVITAKTGSTRFLKLQIKDLM